MAKIIPPLYTWQLHLEITLPKTGFTGVNYSGKRVQIATDRKDRFKSWTHTKPTLPVSLVFQVGGFCKLELLLPHPRPA